MNRSAGLGTAAILCAVVLVGIGRVQSGTAAPASGPSSGSQAATVGSTPKPPEKSGSENDLDKYGCEGLENALRQFFVIHRTQVYAPAYCSGRTKAASLNPAWEPATHGNYMIALLPDPVHTHLALTFDRLTEAIVHAATHADFGYDSSWLPWENHEPAYSRLADQLVGEEIRSAREEQPGLLLFRNIRTPNAYRDALGIFVVGETPTGGVNKTQFQHALAWMRSLDPNYDKHPLRILGPYTSGSYDSLQQLLTPQSDIQKQLLPKSSGPWLEIVSGSASGEAQIRQFHRLMRSALLWDRLRTFDESTSLEITRFMELLNNEGYSPCRVALISEDETDFGNLSVSSFRKTRKKCADRDPAEPILLKYPRDIAALRSEYQREGLLLGNRSAAPLTMHLRLSQDLGENDQEDDDTIRSFAGNRTNLSEEAELLQIVLQLKQHRISYEMLVSTNPLDQIFLAQFLRDAYPAGRVVIVGSDELLYRDQGEGDLRGVLTLTPYPLGPESQHWNSPDHDIFTSYSSQGVFYAAELFMASIQYAVPGAGAGKMHAALPYYRAPFWIADANGRDSQLPPTWLNVISAGKSWPVAVLDNCTLRSMPGRLRPSRVSRCPDPGDSDSLLPTADDILHAAGTSLVPLPMQNPLLPVPMVFRLAVVACLLWMILHGLLRFYASVVFRPRCRAYFSLTRWQHSIVLGLSWSSIGIAATSLLWFSRYAYKMSRHGGWWELALVLVVLVCIGFPLCDRILEQDPYLEGYRGWITALISFAAMAIFGSLMVLFFPGYNTATTVPEQWRGMNLLSGVSPAAPFVTLAIGGYLWCFQHLHGLALFHQDTPKLPSERDLVLPDSERAECKPAESGRGIVDPARVLRLFAQESYEGLKTWALPFGRQTSRWNSPPILWLLSWVGMYVTLRFLGIDLQDLGMQSYARLYEFAVSISIVVMAVGALQVWKVWELLHQLLTLLDRLPLRRTIRGLRDFSWGSVWAMGSSVLECRYRMISRQIECGQHLESAWAHTPPAQHGTPPANGVTAALEEMMDEVRCRFAPWYSTVFVRSEPARTHIRPDLVEVEDMQSRIAALSARLLSQVLLPEWRKEQNSLIVSSEPPNPAVPADCMPIVLSDSPVVRVAEEFVCLNYLAFIQNVTGRMRTLIMGIGLLFLATAVSSAMYPFDPQPLLGYVFLTLFLVLAGVVTYVYAQAHRDATLSNITNTAAGKLGSDFYLKLLQFAIGPAFALVSVLFPSIAGFLFTWIQPGQMH